MTRPWPILRRGTRIKLMQMPRPDYAATILPGDPPELVSGIAAGLQAWVVGVSLASISVRVHRLEPIKEGMWTTWVVA